MSSKTAVSIPVAILLVLLSTPVAGQEDGGNCTDHPLFTRMPNHYIYSCDHSQFEMRRFPVGPLGKDGKAALKEVEGEFWRVTYGLKDGAARASGLQIQRNFQNAAKRSGATVEGSYPEGCVLGLDDSFNEGNNCTSYGTTLRLSRGGKEVWAFINTAHEGYTVYILEVGEMAQDIGISEIADKLAKDGFVALYVNFDTGRATINPDSEGTLDAAAGALKAAPAMKIEVGGHTDNVGSAPANEKLSADRAQAVMAALVKRGIDPGRMTAKGYGQAVPIADNRTEEGRAKNRRVELVKR